MAGSGKRGKKTLTPRGKSKAGTEDAGTSTPDSPPSEVSPDAAASVDPGSGGVTPPTPPPGAPPKKHRGRKSNVQIELEKNQAEQKQNAEEQARRDSQAKEILPMIRGGLKYLSRVMGSDEKFKKWAATDEEVETISGASCAVLVKYVSLGGLNRWKEEIVLIIALGSYAATRIDFEKKPEVDQQNAVAPV